MPEPPRTEVRIAVFSGMVSNVDPNDLQPGYSQLQINIAGLQRGQLEVRRGLRELLFEGED